MMGFVSSWCSPPPYNPPYTQLQVGMYVSTLKINTYRARFACHGVDANGSLALAYIDAMKVLCTFRYQH